MGLSLGVLDKERVSAAHYIIKEVLPAIEVDPDRVSQVLRNLINNAIKFTPENGRVEVSAKVHNTMILFSVKDNGIGISAQAQKKLFEPFYRSADQRVRRRRGRSR